MALRIGIDVGGTFTDLVAVDENGRTILAKSASTPADPSLGVMDGLTELAAALGMTRDAMLTTTERIVHGTTVATNALLERKGAKLGVLTTAGHRDVVEMREGLKDDRYNLRLTPPEPLAPRDRRHNVVERVRADGRVATKLDRRSLERAVAALKRDGVEAVAVCFLHAWRDPRHERIARDVLTKAMHGVYIALSSDVFPQIKEFQRFSTTEVNAYVGPVLGRYLARLAERLADAGYRGPTLIIQSHGGVAPIAESVRLAAGSVLSGPAGGVAGSRYAAKLLECGDLVALDMGGTSTDISLIVDGEATLAADRSVGGHRVALNSLDIATLGAGGGSIARVDRGGILHVGPESAGAEPGPACYGRGGISATVTDANLVLGYLDPQRFLGGRAQLDRAAAERALDVLARELGVSRVAAAAGVHRVVNTNMAEGIRLVTVRRGVDPRRFALLAFGGAAGMHVTDLARQLDLRRVIVPRVAAVLSAWGMLATDMRFEVSRTHIGDAGALNARRVKELYATMEQEGRARLAAAFDGPVAIRRSADMRYGEQVFEIDVPLDDVDWSADDPLPQIVERFHRRHEALYTYALRDREPVLVNARIAAIGVLPAMPREPDIAARVPAAPFATRRVHLGEWLDIPVYDCDALAPGQLVAGPAIVESAMTTVLLRRGEESRTTPQGWLDIAIPRRD
jgi:N-methylhydantoinase A